MLGFLLITITAISTTAPTTAPALPAEIEYQIVVAPDAEAAALGVKSFENAVVMNHVWIDGVFTGWGCLSGPFQSGAIEWTALAGGGSHFRVICEPRFSRVGRVEWDGKSVNGAISGEMWLSTEGEPIEADILRTKAATLDEKVRQEQSYMNSKGQLINDEEVNRKILLAHAHFAIEAARTSAAFHVHYEIEPSPPIRQYD